MRILQLANKFPYPAKDGGSIATLTLAKSFAALGHQVTILAINTSKHYTDPSTVPDDLAASIRFMSVPVNTDVNMIKLGRNFIFSRIPYNAERFISANFAKVLGGLLEDEDFDIIQLEGLYLAPYIKMIRSLSSAKVVMRAHNIEHEIWERAVNQAQGARKWYIGHLANRIRKMELRFLNSYDAILPITGRDGDMLASLGCTLPAHVVPMGINAGDLVPDHSRMEFPSVFHIGALDWMPNQEGLLWFFKNAWDKVMEKYPDLKFYLAGRNAPESFMVLPYKNVVYLGEVDDAYDFIRSKAVMIVPVLSGSGMRIKIIEGMALEKAIVTTSIGTEGIATTDQENILIADDPEGFAQRIISVLDNRRHCTSIGRNARKFVSEHYDNFAITNTLIEFYQKLLA